MINANTQKRSTRDGFGDALLELGGRDQKIIALTADLTGSVRLGGFAQAFPERFFNVGIAEQHMVSMAAGLALAGLTPIAATYGVFLGRAWDQIRISICLSNLSVKLVGTHAGVTVGADGASAQALEDIAMLRALPNLTILSPCDYTEAKKATVAMVNHRGPVYMRLSRESFADITTEADSFAIGKASVLKTGEDVTIVGCGPLLNQALAAAETLASQGIGAEIINMHTIKPLDRETLLASVEKTRAAVTVEEHQIAGGLGGAVAELLAQHHSAPIEMIGVHNSFGESGTAEELLEKYELTAPFIVRAAQRVLKRKV